MRTLALLAAAALCSGAAEFTTYIGDANDYHVARFSNSVSLYVQ